MRPVIHSRGNDINTERILLRRIQAQLCRAPKKQRPDVHGRTSLMRWHVCRVHPHGKLTACEEMVCGDFGDGNESGRMLHSLTILVGSEDVDVTVGRAECFQAFVTLLAVVEAWGHAVDAEVRVFDELRGRPFSRLDGVVGFDVASNCGILVGVLGLIK